MRRICMGIAVAAAMLCALPTAARTFRVDLNACDVPDSFQLECWGGPPSGANPALPANGETNFSTTTGDASAEFDTVSFQLIAFDYAQFMADNAQFFIDNIIASPTRTISHGLSRPDAGINGSDFLATDNKMLRIEWFFDIALLPTFGDIFEESVQVNGTDYFGVQLIFNGQGFELNGLKDFQYSRSFVDSQEIWNGADQACSTFSNTGACAAPEPSSVALLGLALIALVGGLRTGRPARMPAA